MLSRKLVADNPNFNETGLILSLSRQEYQSMKMLWCWRCKADVLMLDDGEFKRVSSLLHTGKQGNAYERMFGPLLLEYESVTGIPETNPNAIYHHVLSMYGPPCRNCGKPLRTPRAKLCGSCMHPVQSGAM